MKYYTDPQTGIILRNSCVRIKNNECKPIRNKKGHMATFSTHKAANHFLAGFARYYRVPAWLEMRNGQPTVTFRHGRAKVKYTTL